MTILGTLVIVALFYVSIVCSSSNLITKCPKAPVRPEGCEDVVELYTRGCLTGYECKKWNMNARNVCSGAPTCPPAPSHECTTSYQHRYIDGVRCEWGCKHWCCQDSADLTCPKHSPTNPYCIGTHIVKYTINGRRCPVYCGCLPDCTVLTC